jgi:hypothetical protein
MSGPAGTIDPTKTIREVLAQYPQTAAVFARHGLAGCGGPAGPLEPLDQFARLHHVDVTALLAELEATTRSAPVAAAANPGAAGAKPVVAGAKPAVAGANPAVVVTKPVVAAAPERYRLYLKTSLVLALSAGFGVGLLAVLSRAGGPSLGAFWLPLVQAHGQVQLLGWVGLFVVGVAYHVVPRFCGAAPPSDRVTLATYGLLLGAVLVRAVAQPLAVLWPLPGAFTLAALLQLAASALFAATLLRWLWPGRMRWEGYEPYLVAAGVWWVVAGGLAVAIAVPTDAGGSAIVASPLMGAYLHVTLYGFVLLAALGVTRRAIPLFMGLRPTSARLAAGAWLALNAAVALGAGGALGTGLAPAAAWDAVSQGATWLALAGAGAFVGALHLFEHAPSPPGAGQPRGHEPYIRTAYGWLLVALGLGAALALREASTGVAPGGAAVAAARHAFALGFVSLLIFGMASRIVPVFGGVRLWQPWLLAPLFVAFNLGVALRVAGELLGNQDALARGLVAASGLLGFGGLALFALVLWRTLDRRAAVALPLVLMQPAAGESPTSRRAHISPDLTVATVLERWPATLPVFLAHGFTPLANPVLRRTLAPRISLAQAASMKGVDPGALVGALEAAARGPA